MRVFGYKMRIEIFFLFSDGAPSTWTPLGEVYANTMLYDAPLYPLVN